MAAGLVSWPARSRWRLGIGGVVCPWRAIPTAAHHQNSVSAPLLSPMHLWLCNASIVPSDATQEIGVGSRGKMQGRHFAIRSRALALRPCPDKCTERVACAPSDPCPTLLACPANQVRAARQRLKPMLSCCSGTSQTLPEHIHPSANQHHDIPRQPLIKCLTASLFSTAVNYHSSSFTPTSQPRGNPRPTLTRQLAALPVNSKLG